MFFTGSTCSDGDVRLVGSYSIKEGRVEYCSSNKWYTLCADSWQESEINTICSTLGYSTDLGICITKTIGHLLMFLF